MPDPIPPQDSTQKEWVVKSTEEWVSLESDTKITVEKALKNIGIPIGTERQLLDQVLFFDSPDPARFKRVNSIIGLAGAQEAINLFSRGKLMSAEIHRLDFGNNGKIIAFSHDKDNEMSEVLEHIDNTITTTNRTLEIFGEPGISKFSSETKRKI